MKNDMNEKDIKQVAQVFINIKKISNIFFNYKQEIDKELDHFMNHYLKKYGFEIIGKLGVLLTSDVNGSLIVSEHKCFILFVTICTTSSGICKTVLDLHICNY